MDWRFAQGNPGMAIIGKPGPPVREDVFQDYKNSEESVRLWHERIVCWREEWLDAGSENLRRCVVAAGRGGPLWIYEPSETAIHVPSVPEERDPDPYLAFMVRPSEEHIHYCLYDDATTYKTG